MKPFTLLIALILSLQAFAQSGTQSGPPSVKGQQDAAYQLPKPNLQFPNKSVTNLGGLASYIDSANTNLLSNSSFEHATAGQDWTTTGATLLAETSLVVDGKKSLKLTTSGGGALSFKQTSTINAAGFALGGVQGAGFFKIRTSVQGLYVCPVKAGVSVTSNYASQCYTVKGNNTWEDAYIPYTLGATDNGVELKSSGSLTASQVIYVDQGFAGPQKLKADFPGMRLLGTLQYPGTAGCNWTTPGGTPPANFTANASCPTPNVTGSVVAPSTKIPGFALPDGTSTGELMIVMNASINGTGAGNGCAFRISDGTNNSFISTAVDIDTSAGGLGAATYRMPRTTSAATTYQLQGGCDSGTGTVNNATANRYETAFSVYLLPSGSSGYSTTNANYSRTAWAPTFTGFGSVTVSDCYHSRDGQYLDIDCKFTSGTSTAVEAQVSLPVVNGVQLTTATSTGTRVAAGLTARSNTGGTNAFTTLMQSNVGYLNFALTNSASSPLTPQNGNILTASGDLVSIAVRIPISQWDNSNIIIGQFNGLESCADSFQCETEYTAKISSSCAVTDQTPAQWINTCTLSGTSDCICTHVTGKFTSTPNYTASSQSTTTEVDRHISVYNVSASGFSTKARNGANADTPSPLTIKAFKTGSDYVTKTARAVSSDANDATPGLLKKVSFWVKFDGGAETTACTASPCTTTELYGRDWINGNIIWDSLGNYHFTTNAVFAPNSYVICTPTGSLVSGTALGIEGVGPFFIKSDSSGIVTVPATNFLRFWNSTGAAQNVYGVIECEGPGI